MVKVTGLLLVAVALLMIPYLLSRHQSDKADYSCPSIYSCVGRGATWWSEWPWPFWVQGPFVKLEIYEWGVRFVAPGARVFNWVVPLVELSWTDIGQVRRCRTGLRFIRRDNPRRSVLFNGPRDEILFQLSRFPVTCS